MDAAAARQLVTGYYRSPAVRERMAEYCGAGADGLCCEYLVGYPAEEGQPRVFVSPSELERLMGAGLDVSRSAWDREALLFCLDLDYVNFDHRGEAYAYPERVFGLLEPVYEAITQVLIEKSISHLAVMTGKGYHFVWQVPLQHPAVARLAARGRPPATLLAKYAHDRIRSQRAVPEALGRAEHGAGMLMEYLAHRVLDRAQAGPAVVCNGLAVPGGERGREVAALDLSGYADPLPLRNFRVAFSSYQKAQAERSWIGDGIADGTPPQFCLPRPIGTPLAAMLSCRRDPKEAARWAEGLSARIPEAGAGTARALAAYLESRTRVAHDFFYAVEPDPVAAWPEGYHRLDLSSLPACAAAPLARPNDLLLVPTYLQTVWWVLAGMGWHPRHVAGLIRSRYESDHGWGTTWLEVDAANRAEAYVRLFYGLAARGLERWGDLNCEAQARRSACLQPGCGYRLERSLPLLAKVAAQ